MKGARKRRNHVSTSSQGTDQSLWCRIKGLFGSNQDEDELTDYAVDTIEPKLKHVRGYRARLQEPLRICRQHCKAIVAEIPGPIYLKRSKYYENPVIKAAFAGSERLEDVLDRAKSALSQTSLLGTKRVGLLTMTSSEKTTFGSKMQGGMVVAEVAMRSITFTDHNVVGLTTTLEASMEALERYCLDIILEAAARELSEIRTKLVDLRQRRERLSAMNKMFGGVTGKGMGSIFVPYDPDKNEKQEKLEKMIAEAESEIAEARSMCETPKDWLAIVEEFLAKPEKALSIQPVSLRLDWRNVLTDDPTEQANVINLATFTMADEMQREGVLVAYEQY